MKEDPTQFMIYINYKSFINTFFPKKGRVITSSVSSQPLVVYYQFKNKLEKIKPARKTIDFFFFSL